MMENHILFSFVIGLFLLNSICMYTFFRFTKSKVEDSKQGLFIWITWLSLLIPVIGQIFGIALWLMTSKKINEPFINFEGSLLDKIENLQALREVASRDKDVIPLAVIIKSSPSEIQKEYILKMNKLKVNDKARFLNIALENKDHEIVHYAATMFLSLQDQYKAKIDGARKCLNSNELNSYQNLVYFYQEYLDSGLLKDHFKVSIIQEYKRLLEKSILIFPKIIFFQNSLAKIYYELGELEKAYDLFIKMIQNFPSSYDGYIGALGILYEKKQWGEMKSLMHEMNQSVQKECIPPTISQTIKTLEGSLG